MFRVERYNTRYTFLAENDAFVCVQFYSNLRTAFWDAEIEVIGSQIRVGTDAPDATATALLGMARRMVARQNPRPDLEPGQEIFHDLRRAA